MCLDLNLPDIAIPDIFLPSPSFILGVNFGTVGVTCCHFTLPAFGVPIPNPIPPAVLLPLIAAFNAEIAAALPTLDAIHIPDCPLE